MAMIHEEDDPVVVATHLEGKLYTALGFPYVVTALPSGKEFHHDLLRLLSRYEGRHISIEIRDTGLINRKDMTAVLNNDEYLEEEDIISNGC